MEKLFIILLVSFVIVSCSEEDSFQDDMTISENSVKDGTNSRRSSTHLPHSIQCRTSVYDFHTAELLDGSAKLVRGVYKISMALHVDDLIPGNAYTIWWVIWNNSEKCGKPFGCTDADFGIADLVEVDVLYATGLIAGANGKGKFKASLREGDDSGSINDIFGLPPANGLHHARTAEVHLVVRDHGVGIPGEIPAQIGTYLGGCDTNECDDIMFSIFSPFCR